MTYPEIHGSGTFAFYFLKPEKNSAIFDKLGFDKGFKRTHASGLTFYIHRARNKKEGLPPGVIPIIRTPSLSKIKDTLKDTRAKIIPFERFGKQAIQLFLDEHQYIICIEGNTDECLLPKGITLEKTITNIPIIGKGHFVMESKDPIKTSHWYADLFNTPVIYESNDLAINQITSKNNSSMMIFHEKKTIKHKNRPLKYKLFGITTNKIYDCWKFLKEKKMISPTWKHPHADGHWRTINLNGPEGYTWKLYGSVPVYSLDVAAQLLHENRENLLEQTQNGNIQSLPTKHIPASQLKEEGGSYYCEDQLLEYLRKDSPYEKDLHFENTSLQSQQIKID